MVKRNDSGNLLCEVTRLDIIRAAKSQSPDRFLKKNNYTTKDFKNLNFKKLFIDDELLIVLRISDYTVSIMFEGAFEELQHLLRNMRGPNRIKRITRTVVQEALSRALDTEDLYVSCSCADFKYRFRYYATQKDYLFGKPAENRHPKFKKTNMDDEKGYVCKHLLAALYGKRWVPFAAKAWLEYIQANPELSEDYIWPNRKRSKRNNDTDKVETNTSNKNALDDESENQSDITNKNSTVAKNDKDSTDTTANDSKKPNATKSEDDAVDTED